jgi:hypothetical protein
MNSYLIEIFSAVHLSGRMLCQSLEECVQHFLPKFKSKDIEETFSTLQTQKIASGMKSVIMSLNTCRKEVAKNGTPSMTIEEVYYHLARIKFIWTTVIYPN